MLCRKCGADATDFTQENFVNVTSPSSEGKELLRPTTLFVQKLTNPGGISFKVLTLHKAGCVGVGKVTILVYIFCYIFKLKDTIL